jgi:hypothetical protein
VLTVVLGLVALGASGSVASAFDVNIHEGITYAGLSPPGQNLTFLSRAVFDDIADQHAQVDGGLSGARDERHFDDCEFDGAAEWIRDRYVWARAALSANQPWVATDQFGNALHTVMDFYAHSNWVEMGFPRQDDPATAAVEVTQSDLTDLSGAPSSVLVARDWAVPRGGGAVRGDILLGNDDWTIPFGWSIDPNGAGSHVPTLKDEHGAVRGRLLVTGEGTGDNECDVNFTGTGIRAYNGLEHSVLNKDNPTAHAGPVLHAKALALATLQTGYEWCRLVRQAAEAGRDGLLLATWVRAHGNPHPAHTPCAAARPGPTPITVTVERVRVLDSGDDDANDPGEIQLGLALYDDPFAFHRSVHELNSGGSALLDDGELMPSTRLPAPLTLCVPSGKSATFALYGWDNDDNRADIYANEFDDKGDDDELLVGFQRRFGPTLPTGTQVVRTADLEVRFRVTHATGPRFACPAQPTPG